MLTFSCLKHAKPLFNASTPSISPARRWLSSPRKQHDPLRVLFCGADEFSKHSLQALHDLKKEKPDVIASIEVVCRPDKRSGRGMKQLHQVPVKPLAQSLNLPLHQIDTFTNWSSPTPVDLVVAVSFGLLVPSRLLNAAKYGGLNVHPSLLPDLKGPAPIQWALMLGRKHTGVSLQTMHPTKFDEGIILDQTPASSVSINNDATYDSLLNSLAPLGADMLRRSIEYGLFMDPQPADSASHSDSEELVHAVKITPEHAQIDWATWPAEKIMRYGRVLDLWDRTTYEQCCSHERETSKGASDHASSQGLRIKFRGPWTMLSKETISVWDSRKRVWTQPENGQLSKEPILYMINGQKGKHFGIVSVDGEVLSPTDATIEGQGKGTGLINLKRMLKDSSGTRTSESTSQVLS